MKRLVIKTVIFSFLALALFAGCKDFFHPEGPEKSKEGPSSTGGDVTGSTGQGTIRIQNTGSGTYSLAIGDVVILNTATNTSTMNTSVIYTSAYSSINYKDFLLPTGSYQVVVGTKKSSTIQLTTGVTRIVRVAMSGSSSNPSITIEVIGG